MFKTSMVQITVSALLVASMVAAAPALADEPAAAGRPPAATPAPAATPTPAPAAAAGTLVIMADADDLVAEIKPATGEARVVGLKKGENRTEVPAGDAEVVITTKAGRRILDAKVAITAGADAPLDVKSRAKLVVQAPADAEVELDGTDVTPTAGQFSVETTPGGHSLVVQRVGHYGQKGPVDIEVGKTTKIVPEFERFDPGSRKTIAWAGILGGGALVITAIIIEANTKYNEAGGDVVRWTLVGAGAVGFVGGTVMLKQIMDEPAPIKDAKFSVQVARTQGGAVATVGLRF